MTAETVRQLPYLAWRNDWAWMETMRGKRWDTLLRQEQAHYRHLLHHPRVMSLLRPMEKELTDAQQCLYVPGFQAGRGLFQVTITPESQFQWQWRQRQGHKKSKTRKAFDLDMDTQVDPHHVWFITETEEPYVNRLCCEDREGRILWQKTQISAEVAVIGSYVYYIRTPKDMHTTGLYVCDALTGHKEQCIYKEKNPEHYLGLIKGSGRTLYLLSEDPSGSQVYHVHGLHVQPLFLHSFDQIVLGRDPSSSSSSSSKKGAHCALLRRTPDGPWEAHGAPLTNWNLPPSCAYDDIEWANLMTGHLLTLREGSETLWYCCPSSPAKALLTLKAGSFFFFSWEAWENQPHQRFMVQSPFAPPFLLHAYQEKLLRTPLKTSPQAWFSDPLIVHKGHAMSTDGTMVPYVIVNQKGPSPPKAQLVYVYGAYGSTTPVNWPYAYWAPLLQRGWAIVYAYVRGGGDRTEEWADQARRAHRHRSVDDLDVVIQATQKRHRLGPQRTVLYGRSAGGVPVGALLARYPKGERVGAVFTEVPYVDVLRTSTNPSLPLTVGEYKEFGDPIHHPEEFHELLHVSPINALPAEGAPGVFVLTRVGLLDKQVLAYESFKWIQRLRGHVRPPTASTKTTAQTCPKYITFAKNQEHVYRAGVFPHYRAMDLAVLEAWAEGSLATP